MWIKKINEFFENMSEYDNNNLVLHVAVDLIDMLKERITFELDDECNMSITVLKYGDSKEDCEVDEEGFMYWLHFTFHKELIDIILSLRPKYTTIQENNKTLINDIKVAAEQISESTDIQNTKMEYISNSISNIQNILYPPVGVDFNVY